MPVKDYTQEKYALLIECLADRYPTYSILDYYLDQRSHRLPDSYFIMRHDVDGNIRNALAMARIDARHGVRATYYFRMKPLVYDADIIRQIHALGHEIGYHYEVLSDTGGNFKKARALFEANLKKIRALAPVRTVCMHGRSLSAHHNLAFWKENSLEDFDLVAEPYLNIDYSDKYYFTDTSRCWDNHKYNLRDIVESLGNSGIGSTNDLIEFLKMPHPKKGAILTHSNFWVDNWLLWMFNKFLFFGLNQLKHIKKTRQNHRKQIESSR